MKYGQNIYEIRIMQIKSGKVWFFMNSLLPTADVSSYINFVLV